MSIHISLPALKEALAYATPAPPWESVLEAIRHADDTGIDLHGANALLAKYAVNALPALLALAEAALTVYENASDSVTGWYQPDIADHLREPTEPFRG